ncbi:DUF488 domain-containing protein [bacterium]|nr:DUF488 domain-containing protein [bacterium]
MPQFTVFTVGHGQLSWDALMRLLTGSGVEVLIDVRAYPYSELAPWFDRDRLEHLVRRAGLEYLWLGSQLGALTAGGRVDYISKEREPRYREGIGQLLTLAGERQTCLLGSQLDPLLSHRHHLIAQTLLRHDVGVVHLLEDGSTVAAHADLFHGLPG